MNDFRKVESFEPQSIVVAFHIGRGGRHGNGGHVTYDESVKCLQDLVRDTDFVDCEADGKPECAWEWKEDNGQVLLRGRDAIERETGYISRDGIYDSDVLKYIEECNDDEMILLGIAARDHRCSEQVADCVAEWLGERLVKSVDVYPSNMEVHTQSGVVHIGRDEFSGFYEAEARDTLTDCYRFSDEAADTILDLMEQHEWIEY